MRRGICFFLRFLQTIPLATTKTTIKMHFSRACYCALAAAGRTGRVGRGGTTAGTARERAPFLPTVRIAKKWLSGETPSSTRVVPGASRCASFTFACPLDGPLDAALGWTFAVALAFVSLAARRCSRLLPGPVASLYEGRFGTFETASCAASSEIKS